MSRWFEEECRGVVAAVRGAAQQVPLVLYFRRGEIRCAPREWSLGGEYELVNGLSIPRDRTEVELLEWVKWQMRNVPCFP